MQLSNPKVIVVAFESPISLIHFGSFSKSFTSLKARQVLTKRLSHRAPLHWCLFQVYGLFFRNLIVHISHIYSQISRNHVCSRFWIQFLTTVLSITFLMEITLHNLLHLVTFRAIKLVFTFAQKTGILEVQPFYRLYFLEVVTSFLHLLRENSQTNFVFPCLFWTSFHRRRLFEGPPMPKLMHPTFFFFNFIA